MDGLKIPSSEKIKSERPRLVKCLVTSLYVFVAFSVTTSSGLNLSVAATDAATGNTTPDINARSYGSQVNRRSASGRVYLLDMMDGAQELPQTGRLVLLRQGDSPAMALRVLRQYPDKRQYAAKWLRRYNGTKDLDPGSQFITIEKVSDKETPPLTSQDKKDLKEIETPAAPEPLPVAPTQAEAPSPAAPVPPVVATPVAPPVVQAAPAIPPPAIVQTPAPQAVAPTPEPPTAPVPPPSVIANAAAPTPPPVLAVPSPPAMPEVATPVVMASPEAQPPAPAPLPEPSAPTVANQDLTAPPLAPAPTASDAAIPPPSETATPPPAAAVPEAENIPPPADNTPTPPAPKAETVPDTAGETAAVSGNGDDLSSIMVEEMKVFDRSENAIGFGAGLFRNTLTTDGNTFTTVYNSGGLIRYSRTLKHMLHYKSKGLQDSFAVDGSMGFYKYLGSSTSGDSYTIVPVSVTARYTLQPSEGFGVFAYAGFVKNLVAQAVNADSATLAGFNSFFPEVGVGMLFEIGPSWYMRADLGLDLLSLSIALKF